MASLNAKDTESNLLKKGFTKFQGDHRYFEFIHNGTLITKTKTSHNSQDINDSLISLMSQQCKVTSGFFKAFAKCTKSKDEYIEELKKKGHIK